ncbi:MAG: thioredoxin [Myxococcota bacterium]
MSSEHTLQVNELNFEDTVLKSSVPVLVDFTATWCGPCKMIAPAIDELANEYQDRAKVAKLDIDESPGLAQKYDVRGVPTLCVFSGGVVVSRHVGAAEKKTIAKLIDEGMTESS